MADTKLSAIAVELTAPAIGDYMYAVDDPAGTPASVYITMEGITQVRVLGEISVEANATTTTFSGASTDFSNKSQVTIFDTNGQSTFATPDHTNDHITVNADGKRVIRAEVSFSGGSSDTYSFAIFKNNGATQLGARTTRKLGTGGDVGSASVQAIADLTSGDTIELWMQNEDDTSAATVQDCSLIVS